MDFKEIVLTKDTKGEIAEKLNAITSAGMFTIDSVRGKGVLSVQTRKFPYFDVWKESKTAECEDKPFQLHSTDNPPLILIRITYEKDGDTVAQFKDGDVFYVSKRQMRVLPLEKNHNGENLLYRVRLLCKPPYKNVNAMSKFERSENARMEYFFARESALS